MFFFPPSFFLIRQLMHKGVAEIAEPYLRICRGLVVSQDYNRVIATPFPAFPEWTQVSYSKLQQPQQTKDICIVSVKIWFHSQKGPSWPNQLLFPQKKKVSTKKSSNGKEEKRVATE